MRGFHTTGLTNLALGEAVPCRPGGTTAEAYKRSKGTNDVAYPALALQKIILTIMQQQYLLFGLSAFALPLKNLSLFYMLPIDKP